MIPLSHQGLYRNSPLFFGGLLASIALLIGGVALAMRVATAGDELLPLVVGTLGLFVLVFAVCLLMALRRHRWTMEAQALQLEERPLVPLAGRCRVRRVPFAEIATWLTYHRSRSRVVP